MEISKVTHPNLEHRSTASAFAPSRDAIRRTWIAGLSFAVVLLAWSFAASARGAPDSFADLAERLLPTVVNIATTQTVETARGEEFEEFFKEFFDRRGGEPPPQQKRRASALGSGFIIDASGYIVTNHHGETLARTRSPEEDSEAAFGNELVDHPNGVGQTQDVGDIMEF